MIFRKISSLRYKSEFKLLTYLIVLSIILSLSGCTTTETLRVENEKVHYKQDSEIIKVILKDAKVINLRGIPVQYYKLYKDKKDVIVYTKTDTNWITERSYTLSTNTNIIKLSEIKAMSMEYTEFHLTKTILYASGLIVLTVLLGLIAFYTSGPDLF
jgi:hypothetical protein